MYVLAELFVCMLLVVAIGTTLFLISLIVLGLGKGVAALAELLHKVATAVATTVPGLVRAYRSGIRVRAA